MTLYLYVIAIVSWLIILGLINPFLLNSAYFSVFNSVLRSKSLSFVEKWRAVKYLLRDLLCIPIHSVLWWIDEFVYGRRINNTIVEAPVFIISQPRCGSTFLHRTLAENDNEFFAITYFEWKWPYICVWYIVDRFNLRPWINRRRYWPKTESGNIAHYMHPHEYGDHEEHGIFLEEKFYRHYFVFRRFPDTSILDVARVPELDHDIKLSVLNIFTRVVSKVALYRGAGRTWLTKENESVEFYRTLVEQYQDASIIFLVRPLEEMLTSYKSLSHFSTLAKTGIDLSKRPELRKANLWFRQRECLRFSNFYKFIKEHRQVPRYQYPKRAVLINYDWLLQDLRVSVPEILQFLEVIITAPCNNCTNGYESPGRDNNWIECSVCNGTGLMEAPAFTRYRHYLTNLNLQQSRRSFEQSFRSVGYLGKELTPISTQGFKEYKELVDESKEGMIRCG